MWLLLASYLEMPVSTTHSCVGGVIGMAMMSRGPNCVIWYEEADEFPYVKGVTAIIVSWVLSPVASAMCSAALYAMTYLFVLRHENSFFRAKIFFPILVGFTTGLNVVLMILKGAKGKAEDLGTEEMVAEAKDGDPSKALVVGAFSMAIAAAAAALITPYLSDRCEEAIHVQEIEQVKARMAAETSTAGKLEGGAPSPEEKDSEADSTCTSDVAEGGAPTATIGDGDEGGPKGLAAMNPLSIDENTAVGKLVSYVDTEIHKVEVTPIYLSIYLSTYLSIAIEPLPEWDGSIPPNTRRSLRLRLNPPPTGPARRARGGGQRRHQGHARERQAS